MKKVLFLFIVILSFAPFYMEATQNKPTCNGWHIPFLGPSKPKQKQDNTYLHRNLGLGLATAPAVMMYAKKSYDFLKRTWKPTRADLYPYGKKAPFWVNGNKFMISENNFINESYNKNFGHVSIKFGLDFQAYRKYFVRKNAWKAAVKNTSKSVAVAALVFASLAPWYWASQEYKKTDDKK